MISISVVNMIPNSWSDEQNQDCEPGISVNPVNLDEMAGTAFTFDNPAGSSALSPAMSGAWAPIFYSTDGGTTWSLQNVLPSGAGAILPTFDVTVRYSGNGGTLYSGLISAASSSIVINRAPNSTTHMQTLVARQGDQPFVEAINSNGKDKVYVGYNGSITHATIDQSMDAATAAPPAGFAAVAVDARNNSDGPKTRTAIHPNGTVYGAFYSMNPDGSWDVVVVKDTNWGNSAPPYQALVDSGDNIAGVRVATSISVAPSGTEDADFGNDRRGWELALAVDPNDDQRVYIVYSQGTSAADYTLHLRRSNDGGATWQTESRTIVKAKNPGVAINAAGDVGFLYQQVVGATGSSRWVTMFEHSSDDFATIDAHTLANVPSSTPTPATDMATYIGDYVKLQAFGKNFYGTFSANNTPDLANFPSGVTYQRNANMATKTLLGNDGVTPVPVSIDPFFFKVTPGTGRVVTVIANAGSFGDACVGSFVDEELTIDNGGAGPLSITNIVSSPDFLTPSVLSYPIKLGAGDSVDVAIRFQPTSPGAKSATITVFSDDPAGPHNVLVSGVALAPRLSLLIADSGDFGKVCVGSFADEPLILNNSGRCPLTVSSITSSPGEFAVPQVLAFPLLIGPGESLPVPIRFAPDSPGTKSATISVVSSDPGSPHTVVIHGEAPLGKLAVTGSLCFGGVKACCRAERAISICNVGECALHVTSVAFKRKSRHWKLVNNPFPATLAPGSCLGVVVRYKATEKSPIACELIIASDDPATPVKTLDVMAYTIWDECGCKHDDDGRKCGCGRCRREHCCEGEADDCCGDEDDED
jgi:HYDIN/CFA65/VesB-like, Ig-like domain/Protein of unknown function (DUF1573)